MTTTMLTLTKERAMAPKPRRTVREVIGWNRRATIYWSVVGVVCVLLGRVHP